MDFQFNTLKENTITILETNNDNATPTSLSQPIIKFGRQNTLKTYRSVRRKCGEQKTLRNNKK
jgi:hypothetical protein